MQVCGRKGCSVWDVSQSTWSQIESACPHCACASVLPPGTRTATYTHTNTHVHKHTWTHTLTAGQFSQREAAKCRHAPQNMSGKVSFAHPDHVQPLRRARRSHVREQALQDAARNKPGVCPAVGSEPPSARL